MIISGYEFRKEKPFSKVYLTGLVRDEKGRKMSKQLGNSPDALKLIESYGADAVRVGLMLSSAAGNDLLFDENLCQQGKNFANKIWNAYRLIDGWEIEKTIKPSFAAVEALDWYENHFNKTIQWVDENFEKYRISDALMTTYKLIWDDFCSWLLELAKPVYGKPIDAETHARIIRLFENNLRLLHPFMPFLTEELWHYISEREVNQALTVSSWPEALTFDNGLITDFEVTKEIVAGIRNFRKDKNISFKEKITVYVTNFEKELPYQASIMKLGMLDEIIYSQAPEKINGGSFRVSKIEFFIPTLAPEDPEAEKEKLQAELKYTQGFLASVEKKLANERFVANAPEQVIAIERKKASDAEEKITMLQKSLSLL
jgi:valyl-tRNA synthetase